MAVNDPTAQNGSVEQLSKRDARALTQYLTVLDEAPGVTGADCLYLVVSQSGGSYVVDVDLAACECGDAEYRDPDGGCKHYRRVCFATGRRAIPAWVDRDAIDPDLGEHVAGEIRFAAADGGVAIDVGHDVDRPVLRGIVCRSIRDNGLPDWAVYIAVAEASLATIEHVLEGDQ